jgi:translation initiation factor 1
MTTPIFNRSVDFMSDEEESADVLADITVHIRWQQRNGRKSITTIENLPDEYDLKKIVKAMRKLYACNGAVRHDELTGSDIIMLQGDNRIKVAEFLSKVGLVKEENIKIH